MEDGKKAHHMGVTITKMEKKSMIIWRLMTTMTIRMSSLTEELTKKKRKLDHQR